jgi:signal transduction histidine kinase
LAQRTGIAVHVVVGELPGDLSSVQEISLFHVADQALNHMTTHASVREVDLRISMVDQFLALTLHDDGVCRCKEDGHDEIGDLEAYATLVGGRLCYHRHLDQGNTVALWLPFLHSSNVSQASPPSGHP